MLDRMAGAPSHFSNVLTLPQTAGEPSFLQVLHGLSSLPQILQILERQQQQLDAVAKSLEELRDNREVPTEKPCGFISPDTLAARKYVSLKEAAYLLNISEKSARRAIERGLLRASKGFRVKRIPVEEIDRYRKLTV